MTIRWLAVEEVVARGEECAALLRDAVTHGASIGFTLPLDATEVAAYWRKVVDELTAGNKRLVAAFDASGRLRGSAQLALESRANGRHRAEVQKVMVLAAARGQGIGAALMRAVEAQARVEARTLLFLDTSEGPGGAVRFYETLGYTRAGGIPDYARDPDGTLAANVIFYKRLT